jgi:hypothetical protein
MCKSTRIEQSRRLQSFVSRVCKIYGLLSTAYTIQQYPIHLCEIDRHGVCSLVAETQLIEAVDSTHEVGLFELAW